jgi:glutamate dehydrogenase (NADP+)
MAEAVAELKAILRQRDPDQKEFLQAADEIIDSLADVFAKEPKYIDVMKRCIEPERVIQFRVPWLDDSGKIQVNRGFRVQFNSAIGPYKGGLRLHPTVNLSVLKFLGFEQVFKNSLTTLAMGGAKGGSDFDPKGKSDAEVMRFCQSFMTELHRHIGATIDVPAGDINVGGREIGFMFGQYKRLTKSFEGVLTGKDLTYGGSLIRPEATGYGCVYYAQEALKNLRGKSFEGLKCTVSGSGNVAQYTVEKLLDLGAIPLTLSDSNGYILEPNGFTREQLAYVMQLKNVKRGRISEYMTSGVASADASYVAGARPWGVPCDVAFPSATQNEVELADAQALVANGCFGVFEGANMPSTSEAIEVYHAGNVVYGPAKAANAGGVACSGLEMSQNFSFLHWSREKVNEELHNIMLAIYKQCADAAAEYGKPGNLQMGANIAGFKKVANAMLLQGCV